jgi:hypothetical protein
MQYSGTLHKKYYIDKSTDSIQLKNRYYKDFGYQKRVVFEIPRSTAKNNSRIPAIYN